MTADLLAQVMESGAGSLAAVARELVGPLAGAATPQPLPWDAQTARVTVPVGSRYAVLLVTLLADTERDQLVVVPRVLLPAPATNQPAVTFAEWSQAGSSLPGYVPSVDASGVAPQLRLSLTATRIAADGTTTQLSPADVRGLLRIDLVQGLTGRVMTAVLAEKQRLRRSAREIAAMRTLAEARGNALDRLGSDLSCPRFADELVWDAERRSPATQPLSPPGRLEDDAEYRARLGLLRGWRSPTSSWVEDVLNNAPGPGLPGPVGVNELRNPIHLAFRLVAPDSPGRRAELLQTVRQVHLIWPAGSADGDAAHAGRLLPQRVQERVTATRASMARWGLPDHQPLSPGLAGALELVEARCDQLAAQPWTAIVEGQNDDGGSRFELGLGALLSAPVPAVLDSAIAAAEALADPGLVPQPRSVDPAGAWILNACGLRTAELTPDGTVFVSTLPMGPLVIDLEPGPDAPVPLTATASLAGATDTQYDAPLAAVVAAMAARQLSAVDVSGPLSGAQPASTFPDLTQRLAHLGVPTAEQVDGFGRQLGAVSTRLFAAFDLGPDGTAAITAHPEQLTATLTAAAAAGASSVVAFISSAGNVVLVLGVTGLPLAGSNLAARQTVLYRWESRGLAGKAVRLDPLRGPTTQIYAAGSGISVVSCLAHVRGLGNDPYEWSPSLPEGSLLTLRQYEHLMNLIELATPVGVRANTWELRQRHIDVDGSGTPFPLTAAAARTYRHYRTVR
ncbi:hypothetical protein AB0E63_24120 [Kribbella sp. NPDC026596]|uniref:hypothetical protein n=1 Tax=Kribbella sp. NPDC026596 TaxID=3155122 RepID=UPI0033D9DACA